MAKVVDITDKLTFDGNPCLMVKGEKIEVNADAPTMMKVLNVTKNGGASEKNMNEFRSLLAGLSPDTPLGRMVAIRSESDKEVIKRFTSDQKRIYNEWRDRKAESMTKEAYEKAMDKLEQFMADCFGGG